ncbi:MAG: ZIP family metal transporter [Terriglobales bacterium]
MPAAYIWALALGVLAALANVFGGLVLTGRDWEHQYLRYFVAIGAGFMLGTALLEMLPQSWKLNAGTTPILLLGGYLLVHLVEHSFVAHFHFGEETHAGAFIRGHVPVSVLAGLCIHTFFDGVAIGSGFLVSSWLGGIIFLAIFMHKVPEGFTIASVMLAAGRGNRTAVLSAAALGATSVLGVAVMLLFPVGLSEALPFAAGVTLYVAATDLIPEVNREAGIGMAFCVFLGVAILAGLQWGFRGI